MNAINNVPGLLDTDDESMEEDLHPYAPWTEEQEQGVLVMTAEDMLLCRLYRDGCHRLM